MTTRTNRTLADRFRGCAAALSLSVLLVGCADREPANGRAEPQSTVQVLRDVAFEEGGLALDVYEPARADGGLRAGVVLVHGGGFYSGDRSELAGAARAFAEEGLVAATIDYRIDPSLEEMMRRTNGGQLTDAEAARIVDAFEAASVDSRAAVRHLKESAARLQLDPNRIAVVGWSAGGSISLGHALERDFDHDGTAETPDVAAVVAASASLGDPLDVAADAPPVLVVAFERDTGNTLYPPAELCPRLELRGADCTTELLSGSGHEIDLARIAPEIIAFLDGPLELDR